VKSVAAVAPIAALTAGLVPPTPVDGNADVDQLSTYKAIVTLAFDAAPSSAFAEQMIDHVVGVKPHGSRIREREEVAIAEPFPEKPNVTILFIPVQLVRVPELGVPKSPPGAT
jgi:hypothetical protein